VREERGASAAFSQGKGEVMGIRPERGRKRKSPPLWGGVSLGGCFLSERGGRGKKTKDGTACSTFGQR